MNIYHYLQHVATANGLLIYKMPVITINGDGTITFINGEFDSGLMMKDMSISYLVERAIYLYLRDKLKEEGE